MSARIAKCTKRANSALSFATDRGTARLRRKIVAHALLRAAPRLVGALVLRPATRVGTSPGPAGKSARATFVQRELVAAHSDTGVRLAHQLHVYPMLEVVYHGTVTTLL